MNAAMALFGGGVILSLAAIAVVDARTKLVSARWLAALVAAGLGWLVLGGAGSRWSGLGPGCTSSERRSASACRWR